LVGLVLVVVIIGAAIYAQWIRPEAEVNDVGNNKLLGNLPAWVPYTLLAIALPLLLLYTIAFLTPAGWVIALAVGMISLVSWSYRKLFTA
jgi:hypothetical protein